MDVVKVCPRLLHGGNGVYEGYITVKNQDFYIKITVPRDGCLKNARLQCEWRVQHLLRGYKHLLQQRLRQSSTLADFLVEFKSVLENQLTEADNLSVLPDPGYYKQLLKQIEILGWERWALSESNLMFILSSDKDQRKNRFRAAVVYVDSEFRELHVQLTDDGHRRHTLKVLLHAQHPDVGPACKSDLPSHFDRVWKPDDTGLLNLYEQFAVAVSQYQVLWDELGNIDRNTWVLEPEKPAYNATYRRIALGNNGSIQINVDPSHPRVLPECRFLGADHVIGPLKQKLNRNVHLWDPDNSLLSNLETVLEISFPSPENTKKEDISVACGICYTYRLDAQIPDQVCEDSRCAQPFHQTCLYEWLRALPSCRQSFNTVFGECPYCSKAITVKMPTTK